VESSVTRVGSVRRATLDGRSATMLYRSSLAVGNYLVRGRWRDSAGNLARTAQRRFRVQRATSAHVYRELPSAGHYVALTFDDCNEGAAWTRILDVLRRARLHATFFCPGLQVRANPALAARTVREGNNVGSHGWDHADLSGRSWSYVATRLVKDRETWWDIGGATAAPYFRPPYGAYDSNVLRVAGEESLPRVMMWSVDPQDWRRPGSSVIAGRVINASHSGSIVIMHVISQTSYALPSIIAGLAHKGLRPVTLDELFSRA
jgi:peptidoglycan/xylan/chitin deacetylase (PgdA/CDA1 family)